MLWIHQWGPVAFAWGEFHRECSRYLSLVWVWKCPIEIISYSPRGQWVNSLKPRDANMRPEGNFIGNAQDIYRWYECENALLRSYPFLRWGNELTHWSRVTQIYVCGLNIIGSENGFPPGRRQAAILTYAEILLIGPLGTSGSEILIEIHIFSFIKMCLKVSFAKWRQFCLGPSMLAEIVRYIIKLKCYKERIYSIHCLSWARKDVFSHFWRPLLRIKSALVITVIAPQLS